MTPEDQCVRLVELERPRSQRVWFPFEHADGYTDQWWLEAEFGYTNARWFSVQVDGLEVGRVKLDEGDVSIDHYTGTPCLGLAALQIEFIEVRGDYRLRGVGTSAVAALTEAFHGRRLVAFSEAADGFWASLGWDRFEHPDHAAYPWSYRVLFIQPAPS
jgi:hypothetical protein